MMLAMGLSLLSCLGAENQLEAAKEQLFDAWSSHSAISQVTLGLPTDTEMKLVLGMVESLRKDVVASTAGELTTTQRQLDVPFMLGMLDGIEMEFSPEVATTCIQRLVGLDDAVSRIFASRLWRMRLRAAIILKDRAGAIHAANAIRSIKQPDQEDLVAATLFDIERSIERGDVVQARVLYESQDTTLVRRARHRLRGTLASGYARIAPSTSESLFGWFHLATWYVEHGVSQIEVDQHILAQLQRLHVVPNVIEQSEDVRLAALATRLAVEHDLESGRIGEAMNRLMRLARSGDVHAAERILLHREEPAASALIQEALAIVLSHPKQVGSQIAYWRLFAATNEVRQGDYKVALELLAQIPETSEYFERARTLARQLQSLDVVSMSDQIQSAPIESVHEVVSTLVESSPPIVVQELLRNCIDRWHKDGDISLGWLRTTVLALLEYETDVSPGVRAEAYRLLGKYEDAEPLFLESIENFGPSIPTTAGLADCDRDVDAMRLVVANTSSHGQTAYWYWLSNVRLLQWHLEDDGQWIEAIAKINRLRLEDETLGGVQFAVQFNALGDSP